MCCARRLLLLTLIASASTTNYNVLERALLGSHQENWRSGRFFNSGLQANQASTLRGDGTGRVS